MTQVALVTGASRGVGAATAAALAQDGWTVALLARSEDRLEAVAADIRAQGGQAIVCAVDVADAGAVERAVQTVI